MRIIAGTHRGRRLRAPKGMRTRPTTDRVREALFSILGNIHDQRVIDCYSGTGALGIEAVSRGARNAILVEADLAAIKTIRSNLEELGLNERCDPWHNRVENLSRRLAGGPPLDLVLADPPWPIAQAAAEVVAKVLPRFLAKGATVVLGHPTRSPVEVPERSLLRLVERRSWGDSGLSFYRYEPAGGSPVESQPPLD